MPGASFTVMAGVNAFRSRGDAEKVKLGLQRKHQDGGSFGPARLGYLNVREPVGERQVAGIAVDHDRAPLVKLAFDLAATGDQTISSITEVLDDAGLRTRPTPKRPSRPLSRSQVHRILRDDFYVGVVTLNGVKRDGRHEALIDRETFDRVQAVLSAHRKSGDRSHKHEHYLRGSLHCTCGRRLGYGRHRSKSGAYYEYFSCLSRVTRDGRCGAPYFAVDRVERAIERHYGTLLLPKREQDALRSAVQDYAEAKTAVARREAARHSRRLRELTAQQQKLLQLYYRGTVGEDVLEAEQQRIGSEREKARKASASAAHDVHDLLEALDDALKLVDAETVPYRSASPVGRRMINQALYKRLIVSSPDDVQAESPLLEHLVPLARELAAVGAPTGNEPGNDTDPVLGGRCSYFDQMAEREGFEPSRRVNPAHAISNRAP